jgi:hypothetical protein
VSSIPLIVYGLLICIMAIRAPGTVAGFVLGAHGLVASLSYLSGLAFTAVGAIGAFSGLVVLAVARWRWHGKRLFAYQQLLVPIAFLGGAFAIGAIQEYWRGLGSVISIDAADGIVEQLSMLALRNEKNGTWIVVTRWIPYTFIAVLGCTLDGPKRVMNGFSLASVLQVALIPTEVYGEYFSQLLSTGVPAGLEWEAINRAYLGYECSIAASWFLLTATRSNVAREAWWGYCFSIVALMLVVLSWSKGPHLAMIMSLAVMTLFVFLDRGGRARTVLFFCYCIFLLAGAGFFLFHKYGADSQFITQIETSLRVSQSVSIRWDLLTKAAFPSASDLQSWLFGKGFGWSRWQVSQDTVLPVFVGVGTHVFFLDALLDVGVVGLLLIATGIFLIYLIVPPESAALDADVRLISQFVSIYFVILLTKMLVASDTYSEPLTALFIGLLFGRAVQFLVQRGNKHLGNHNYRYRVSKELK